MRQLGEGLYAGEAENQQTCRPESPDATRWSLRSPRAASAHSQHAAAPRAPALLLRRPVRPLALLPRAPVRLLGLLPRAPVRLPALVSPRSVSSLFRLVHAQLQSPRGAL